MAECADDAELLYLAVLSRRQARAIHAGGDGVRQVPVARQPFAELLVAEIQDTLARFAGLDFRVLDGEVAGHDQLAEVAEHPAEIGLLDPAQPGADGDLAGVIAGKQHQQHQLLQPARLIAEVLEDEHARRQVADRIPAHHRDRDKRRICFCAIDVRA